jgi:hypothetical protein
MSTDYHAPMHNTVEHVIDNHARPLTAGAGELASLLSEVHASVLAHDELCHLADALEDVLFDVMPRPPAAKIAARRQAGPGASPSDARLHWIGAIPLPVGMVKRAWIFARKTPEKFFVPPLPILSSNCYISLTEAGADALALVLLARGGAAR